jgi:uncharacterized protein
VILVDAGPLVALVHAGDRHHDQCRRVARTIRDSVGTVWPAVAEAMYLLNFSWRAQDSLWQLMDSANMELLPLGTNDSARMGELMRKYQDLPMDLADAALVRVAERDGITRVFTLDRRDFELYRPARLGRFSVIP